MKKLIRGYKKEEFSSPEMIFQVDISIYAKITYMYLQMLMDIEGDVEPSKNQIAYYIGASESSADRAIKELEKVGLIDVINRKKSPKVNETNIYIVNHPKQVDLKLLTPYEEVKYLKKKGKKKGTVSQTPPLEKYGLTDPTLKSTVSQTPPHQNISIIKGSEEKYGLTDRVSSLDSLDSIDIYNDNLTDEEIIKLEYKKHLKDDITSQQAKSFIEVAYESNLSIEEVIVEIEYIAKNVRIKNNPAGTVYSSLLAGGWYKKKQEEKKQQPTQDKPKRLKRSKLPKSVEKQLKEAQTKPATQENEPQDNEDLAEKKARLQEKLRLMNERLAARTNRG